MTHCKSKISYHTFNYPTAEEDGKTLLTGVRGVKNSIEQVYISGWYQPPGEDSIAEAFVYKGDLEGRGTWHNLSYPSSIGRTVVNTNLYGPNNGKQPNHIQVVGNYTTEETGTKAIGCLYEGPLDGSGKWTTIIPSLSSKPVLNTICHSTMGGLVVGNYDTSLIQGKAFIYDISTKQYYDIVKNKAKSITAYGIWHNGGNHYTICGGYTNLNIKSGVDSGYLVDWDNKEKKLFNWKSYSFNNNPLKAIITHFDGITSDGCGGYNLTGDWIGIKSHEENLAFFAHVKRNKCNKSFEKARWLSISYPLMGSKTSGNTVYKNNVLGVYSIPNSETVNGYVAEIN